MNSTCTLVLSALFVPLMSAAIAPADSLTYHPGAGTKLTRAWTIKQELTLNDLQMTMNGQPLPMDLQMDMNTSMQNEIHVTDLLVAVEGGSPKELRRTFDKLSTSGEFKVEMPMLPDGGMENSLTGSSKLEGKTVKFVRKPDSEEYEVTYHESEGETDLLTNLDEDMDLRGVLPGKDVAVGDTWDIDVKKLKPLLAPGGDVGIRPEKVGDQDVGGMMPGMDNMGDMSGMIGDLLEGKATAEYKGIEEKDGGKFAVIALTINIKSANDMADKMAGAMKDMPEGVNSMDIEHMDVEFSMEAKGTLQWDLTTGVIHSIDLSGDVDMDTDMGMAVDGGGKKMNIEQNMSMSGTISIALEVTKG